MNKFREVSRLSTCEKRSVDFYVSNYFFPLMATLSLSLHSLEDFQIQRYLQVAINIDIFREQHVCMGMRNVPTAKHTRSKSNG